MSTDFWLVFDLQLKDILSDSRYWVLNIEPSIKTTIKAIFDFCLLFFGISKYFPSLISDSEEWIIFQVTRDGQLVCDWSGGVSQLYIQTLRSNLLHIRVFIGDLERHQWLEKDLNYYFSIINVFREWFAMTRMSLMTER